MSVPHALLPLLNPWSLHVPAASWMPVEASLGALPDPECTPCAAAAAADADACCHNPAGSWLPAGAQLNALPELMRVEEASSVWGRIALACLGWMHLRPLQLHFTGKCSTFGISMQAVCTKLS
jgi:hypothetical protein